MKTVPLKELYASEYSLYVANALEQKWRDRSSFSCISKPKKINLFLFFDGISAEYTIKNNDEKIYAHSGDIVYTPIGCEYSVRFFNIDNEHSRTFGINFYLYEQNHDPFIISEDICIFRSLKNADYRSLFQKVTCFSQSPVACPSKMKSGMYDILSSLGEPGNSLKNTKFDIISKGISYLENNSGYDLNVSDIAKMCNVSPGYFRRLFKEYSGYSPIDYILINKIEKAKIYLEYEDISIGRISELLNFTDPAYFTKQFKIHTGITPHQFRKRTRAI